MSARRIALLGSPVAHSLSPVFQNAAFGWLGPIDGARSPFEYVSIEVREDELAAVVDEIRAGALVGANVTLPYKEAVVPHVDRLTDRALAVGAVNTLSLDRGVVVGDNTDVSGLARVLRALPRAPSNCVVLGAGGAGRAALAAAASVEGAALALANRTEARARRVADALRQTLDRDIAVVPMRPETRASHDLVIHATSLAVGALPGSPAHSSALEVWRDWFSERAVPTTAIDLAYLAAGSTPFLSAAAEAGVPSRLDGLEMLLYQGMEAFAIWTGRAAPEDVMRAALREEVLRRGG